MGITFATENVKKNHENRKCYICILGYKSVFILVLDSAFPSTCLSLLFTKYFHNTQFFSIGESEDSVMQKID